MVLRLVLALPSPAIPPTYRTVDPQARLPCPPPPSSRILTKKEQTVLPCTRKCDRKNLHIPAASSMPQRDFPIATSTTTQRSPAAEGSSKKHHSTSYHTQPTKRLPLGVESNREWKMHTMSPLRQVGPQHQHKHTAANFDHAGNEVQVPPAHASWRIPLGFEGTLLFSPAAFVFLQTCPSVNCLHKLPAASATSCESLAALNHL